MRQQPARGQVASSKEKDRKPLDPPPVVQLEIHDGDASRQWLQSPYFFVVGHLYNENTNEAVNMPAQTLFAGQVSSSLHRLKDFDNCGKWTHSLFCSLLIGVDSGYFIFGDLSVKVEGKWRLKFSLFEMREKGVNVVFLCSILTDPFTVYSPTDFPGMGESTFLSRSLAEQGVRLRIRKEPRTTIRGRPPVRSTQQYSQEPTLAGPLTVQSTQYSQEPILAGSLMAYTNVRPAQQYPQDQNLSASFIASANVPAAASPVKRPRTSYELGPTTESFAQVRPRTGSNTASPTFQNAYYTQSSNSYALNQPSGQQPPSYGPNSTFRPPTTTEIPGFAFRQPYSRLLNSPDTLGNDPPQNRYPNTNTTTNNNSNINPPTPVSTSYPTYPQPTHVHTHTHTHTHGPRSPASLFTPNTYLSSAQQQPSLLTLPPARIPLWDPPQQHTPKQGDHVGYQLPSPVTNTYRQG
ncbi:MAG: hypothetical protein M1834_003012 [Cirrosporium novae-zelandiae]|nr:MAG: hypothetical protein M1834_003012 [Cirrosporium novae-zelandiae]